MNKDNFIVRRNLESVHIFEDRGKWDSLTDDDRTSLHDQVSKLPTTQEQDGVEARSFDLIALRMQLATIQSDSSVFERHRLRVMDMAELLQEKDTIPAVREQLAYLASMQEEDFWNGMNVHTLEDMRLRLRGLAQFIDKKNKTIVYTDFEDEIQSVKHEEIIEFPKITGMQYEKRVRAYLEQHEDHLVIQRLRNNQPLTSTDLEGLENALIEIGSDDGEKLLDNLLERTESESLPHLIRSMVGMDRQAAQAAFSKFLNDRSLNSDQIRFVELIIDQLTERGVMDAGALYEAPFNRLHTGGPEALFAGHENVIEGIFGALDTTLPVVTETQVG